jgi:polar amino acid transport system substrate-binding protein
MTKLFFILTTVFLVSVQPLFSAELTILTENLPPLNYLKENVLVGPSVEIVKEIQRKVGSREQIKLTKWLWKKKMLSCLV